MARRARPRCCPSGVRGENRSADYQDSDGAAFSPDETMFGGSREPAPASCGERTQRLRDARARLQGRRIQHRRRTCRPTSAASMPRRCTASSSGCARPNADGTLAGDMALFYMRRNDQQVPTGEQLEPGNPLSFVLYTDNAARGENYGLEATLRWRPVAAAAAGPARRACSRRATSATYSTNAISTAASRRTRRSISSTWASNTRHARGWYRARGLRGPRRLLLRRFAR